MGRLITERPDVSRALARIIKTVPLAKQTELQRAYTKAANVKGLPRWAQAELAKLGIT